MPVKTRASADEKLRIVQLCESGELSQGAAAKQLGVSQTSVYQWVCQYRERGPSCFNALKRNQSYSPELKFQAVQAYLTGQGSLQVISSRYGLRSKSQLQRWIRMYNKGRNFGQERSGGSRMTTSRNQQVYTWVKKYSELGEDGLDDRRGKRKAEQEPRSELEEMKIKMAKLEQELYRTKVERDLLKKVEELERRDAYRK